MRIYFTQFGNKPAAECSRKILKMSKTVTIDLTKAPSGLFAMKARAIQEQIELEMTIAGLVSDCADARNHGWSKPEQHARIAELQKLYTANEGLVKIIDLKIQSLCGGAV